LCCSALIFVQVIKTAKKSETPHTGAKLVHYPSEDIILQPAIFFIHQKRAQRKNLVASDPADFGQIPFFQRL
jgi:hypothetical protein